MPYQMERIAGEPILVATLSGVLTHPEIIAMFAETARLADELGCPLYRITIAEEGDISFGDLVMIMADVPTGLPGSPSDPRIHGMIVGRHEWARFYTEALHQEQYKQMNIPLFETRDAAMAYIQKLRAQTP